MENKVYTAEDVLTGNLPVDVFIGIYLIRSKTTGLQYVGKSIDIFYRWVQHEKYLLSGRASGKLKLHYHKYGFLDFEFSILELTLKNELGKSERRWVDLYNTLEIGLNTNTPSTNSKINSTVRQPIKRSYNKPYDSKLGSLVFNMLLDKYSRGQYFPISKGAREYFSEQFNSTENDIKLVLNYLHDVNLLIKSGRNASSLNPKFRVIDYATKRKLVQEYF